jgi:hypothetical protein
MTQPFDPSTVQDVSSFIGGAIPDPSELHPLAGLNQDTLDYLTLEDSALKRLVRRPLLWDWYDLPHCADTWRDMGTGRGLEQDASNGTTKAALERRSELGHPERAVLGKLGGRGSNAI